MGPLNALAARPPVSACPTQVPGRRLPLAPCQSDVWQDHRAYPNQAHLTIGGCAFLHGPVKAETMRAAAQAISAECDALRLCPSPQEGAQRLLAEITVDFRCLDFSQSPDPATAITAHWQKMAGTPIPLREGHAPWFLVLSKASETLYGLMPLFHHTVMDGYGSSVFVRRLAEHYCAIDQATALPPLGHDSYQNFIAAGEAYCQGPALRRDLERWVEQFPSLPPPLLPRHAAEDNSGTLPAAHLESQALPRALYQRAEQASKAMGATPFPLCLAALAVLLAQQSGQRDLVIAVPTLNRAGRSHRQTPGLFAGLLPVRLEVDFAASGASLVQQVAQKLRAAYRTRRVPITQMGQALGLLGQGRERLFDVIFSYESLDYACSFGPARLRGPRQLFSGTARYPLGVTLCDFAPDQDLELTLEASCAHLNAATAALWGARYQRILDSLSRSPDAALSALPLLAEGEAERLLALGDGPSLGPPKTLLEPFSEAVQASPEACALRMADGTNWTYQRLDQRVKRLARGLTASLGDLSGQCVGLHLAPGADLVASMLAVMACRAAFVPLDCDAPLDYRQQRLNDCQARAVITDDGSFHMADLPVLRSDRLAEEAAPTQTLPLRPEPQDTAYILFTSGSSGRPKAVAVAHQALWARLSHLADLWQIGPEDCGGAVARPTFDPSLIALLMPLMRGATVALPRNWRMDQRSLAQFVRQHGVSFAPLVPATLALLRDGLALGRQPAARLRVVCCGGEALSPALAASFQQQTGARVDNLYGPTEATIYASRWPCPSDTALPPRLPIGRPVAETSLRLLTPEGQLAPSGAPGEIAIGGLGLAQGYWREEAQTKARFVALPRPDGGHERLYLTGDQGRWRDDGSLDFLGRQDRQLKINGQRIEPAEIEALLAADPAVSAAVVDARGQACGRRLHGWVVSDCADPDALSTRLLDRIADRLPLQMTLASLTVLAQPPLNSAGKIDLRALPTPEASAPASAAEAADNEPTTPLEREVAALWAQALRRDGLGLHDNLFALGGDSLSAMAVLTGLERMVGPGLPLSLLVRHPTIATQVRALGEALSHRAVRLAQADPQAGPAAAPLFIAASGHGDALRFRALADALGGSRDVYMLQPPLGSAQQQTPTFTRLAEGYSAQIAEVLDQDSPQQPVLVGFSLGGVAALETARTLATQGKGVAPLILIDTSYPYASPMGEKVWRLFARLVRRLGLHHRLPSLQRWIAMLDDQGLGWQLKALHCYHPARYDGPVSLLISSGMRPLGAFLFRPWRKVCPTTLRTVPVVGMHGTLLRPGRVEALAQVIQRLAAKD